MELKEYIKIIKNNLTLFIGVIVFIVLAVFVYFSLRPISYSTSLTIEVTRKGSQATQDYKFDDFYRLQADERFGETIVQWLKSPAVVSEIYKNAEIDNSGANLRKLSSMFKASKLSSQIVAVSFSAKNIEDSLKISQSISSVLESNTEKLNAEQKQDNWFKIESQNPIVIKDSGYSLIYFFASVLAGMFLSFWIVMVRHYLK